MLKINNQAAPLQDSVYDLVYTTRLQRIDEAKAEPRPDNSTETWAEKDFDESAEEQVELHQAEGEREGRVPEETTARTEFESTAAKEDAERKSQSAKQAWETYCETRARLQAFVVRHPHATAWYYVVVSILVLADIAGVGGAAIVLGDLVFLALIQALGIGVAAVVAGKAGQEIREMRLTRLHKIRNEELPDSLRPWMHLFRGGDDGERLSWFMIKLGFVVVGLISVGIGALRWVTTGTAAGVVFGSVAAGIGLASTIAAYFYADPVKDKIDQAHKAAQKASQEHQKASAAPVIGTHAASHVTARSVRAEQEALGAAAKQLIRALKYRMLTNNPHVVGHGPGAQSPLFLEQDVLFNVNKHRNGSSR